MKEDDLLQIKQLQDQLSVFAKKLADFNSGTRIYREVLRNSGIIEAGCTFTIDLLAGREGALKPTEIQMYGLNESGTQKVPFEIVDILVMGYPQLVSYQGCTIPRERVTTKFFETPVKIDWAVFGAYSGHGLTITARNTSRNRKGVLHVMCKGYIVPCDLIGRG